MKKTLKPKEELVTPNKLRCRSVGMKESLYYALRSYCDEHEMSMVDFLEAATRYAMEHGLKVKTTVEIDYGELKR